MEYSYDAKSGAIFIHHPLSSGKIVIKANEVRKERTGIHARLRVTVWPDGGKESEPLASDNINIEKDAELVRLSNNAFKQLKPEVAQHWTAQGLKGLLTRFCDGLWEQHDAYTATQVVALNTETPYPPPEYLIDPLVAKGQPNFFFGLGGCGKSELATLFSICLQLPWNNNPLGLNVKVRDTQKMLYCDWETNGDEVGWKLQCLTRGLDLPYLEVPYLRCERPLSQSAGRISKYLKDNGTKCIIIDSLAQACGGEQKESETAINFFAALRSLNVTSIVLAHTSKGENFGGGGKSIYGSVFFMNYGRNIWEVKKTQELGEDEIVVGLFHQKSNSSKLHKPMAFDIKFDQPNGKTVIKRTDMAETKMSTELPLKFRIQTALTHGLMGIKALAEELDVSEATVRTTLYRYKNLFVQVDDQWGLLDSNH
jgi:hypothetical protein